MSIAFIALGSNIGDRSFFLDQAILRLRAQPGITVQRLSSYYETAAQGGPPDSPDYLNAVVQIVTQQTPKQLLQTLLDIEQQFGRIRSVKNAPRTLDMDLLLYDDQVHTEDDLQIPHPRMQERVFVLQPLTELAPDRIHPVLNKSMQELLQGLLTNQPAPRKWQAKATPAIRELAGLRAMVTGSTSGIGKAIAVELAQGGADVLVHGRRSLASLDDVLSEIEPLGVQSQGFQADLRDADECHLLCEKAWNVWGGIDIWINNAGADTLTGPAAKWTFEHKLAELFSLDVTATMLVSRDMGERMRAARGGVILTMGWDQAETGMEGDSGQLFAAIKGAVTCFTRSLAKSLAPRVRVNCLAPGWIKTSWGESASATWQNRVRRETPLQRWGLPEDVAATARWLSSPAAAFITGQTIYINGGVVCG